ncbi:MAG TPA: glycosyltransferase family 4 protein [Actinomycetota bacterium]|nr:glycosyltransferase family 4 protein [Actinomycetota bacterium]
MRLVVITPHFAPDTAPTGSVMTRVVQELAERGHEIEVLTSLPWYRDHAVEAGYEGRLVRREDVRWGQIVRMHPFPAPDKKALVRRALAFAGFSILGAVVGVRGPKVDGVLAVSPPLTLGLTGWAVARARRGSLVFNVQDVYPDVAVELGILKDGPVLSASRRLERLCYSSADAVTVLSEDLQRNVQAKTDDPGKVRVIPNFVDVNAIAPAPRHNDYRREFGLGDKTVVMYAGNVGLSQSLETVLDAAGALSHDDQILFVINGQGAERERLEHEARGLSNVRFVDMQPAERLPEVLAAADIHLVPLKKGLASSSVPSKTYSILAAGRPLIAGVDAGSEIANLLARSGGGIPVPPEDAEMLTKAIRQLVDAPAERERMGADARSFVESWASPAAVALAYEELFEELDSRAP